MQGSRKSSPERKLPAITQAKIPLHRSQLGRLCHSTLQNPGQKSGRDGRFSVRHLWHILPKSYAWRQVLLICPEEKGSRGGGSQQVPSDTLCHQEAFAVPDWHCPPRSSSRGYWVWTGQCPCCTPFSALKGHCWSLLEHKILPVSVPCCILEMWQAQPLPCLLGTSSLLATAQRYRNMSHGSGESPFISCLVLPQEAFYSGSPSPCSSLETLPPWRDTNTVFQKNLTFVMPRGQYISIILFLPASCLPSRIRIWGRTACIVPGKASGILGYCIQYRCIQAVRLLLLF